jgi:ATP-dependent Clp protease adapter protein ClpS
MNTYNNLVILIKAKKKTRAEFLAMMDVFLMNDRITTEQYQALVDLMNTTGLE